MVDAESKGEAQEQSQPTGAYSVLRLEENGRPKRIYTRRNPPKSRSEKTTSSSTTPRVNKRSATAPASPAPPPKSTTRRSARNKKQENLEPSSDAVSNVNEYSDLQSSAKKNENRNKKDNKNQHWTSYLNNPARAAMMAAISFKNDSNKSQETPEYVEQRKECSNKAFTDFTEKIHKPKSTFGKYAAILKYWKKYCDEHFDSDYTVTPEKVAVYLAADVMKRTVPKKITVNGGYEGVVGLRKESDVEDIEEEDQAEIDDIYQTEEDIPSWELLDKPFDDVIWTESSEPGTSQQHAAMSVIGTARNESSKAVTRLEAVENPEPPKPAIIRSLQEKTNVIQNAVQDENGNRYIHVPISLGGVNGTLKALIHLWGLQALEGPYPNQTPHPRKHHLVQSLLNDYERNLVKDKISTGTTRVGACAVRDTYGEAQLIQMACYTWMMEDPRQESGKRVYSYKNRRFPHLRERLSILARHHMLLRDEDIRNLNLADVFNIQNMHSAPGSKLATGLVFRLPRGKTNTKGTKMYASAFRHRNYLRCTVAAFAFYMFERFQVEEEPLPDFSNPNSWSSIKVLTESISPEFRVKRREQSLSSSNQVMSMSSVMRNCKIYSTKVTHSGRHAGTAEAYSLRLNLDHIRHLGRWSMGQMENFYAPKNPIIGAFYMAHFNKREEPYFIERDLVTPPIELQRLIFPWIEGSFSDMPHIAPDWPNQCVKEMWGVDPDKATEDDVFWKKLSNDGQGLECSNGLNSSALIDRFQFLKLLVRMRRVILQDAVMFMNQRKGELTLVNPLMKAMPEIFECQMFKDFSHQLTTKILAYRERAMLIDPNIPLNYSSLVNASNNLSLQQSTMAKNTSDTAEHVRSMRDDMKRAFGKMEEMLAGRQGTESEMIRLQSYRHALELINQKSIEDAQWSQRLLSTLFPDSISSSPVSIRHTSLSNDSGIDDLQDHAHLTQESSRSQPSLPSLPSLPEVRQLQQQLNQSQSNLGLATQGYMMYPDSRSGGLSVRAVWDEFHGPVQGAIKDKAWPHTNPRRQFYNRRKRFIEVIKLKAKELNKDTEEYVDYLSTGKYKDLTVNRIHNELIKKDKGKDKADEINAGENESITG